MMTLKVRLFILLFWANWGITWSQGRLELGGFVGVAGYLGDLNKSDWLSKEPRPAYGAFVRYNLTPRLSGSLSLLHGRLSGRDSHYADRASRNFSTTTPINELTAQVEFNLWPLTDPRNPRNFSPAFTPYLFVGAGVATTKPAPDFENVIVAKPEYTDGAEADGVAKYSNTHVILPFGLGLKYRFRPEWTLTVEAGFRLTFSDYLDGISAAANPAKNDRYKFSGVTLAYRFKKSATKCIVDY
ncbi:MAG: hypothetical protein EAZ50_13115 [Runella slithyformis]|nr:MAG: hypothetical protein EAZ50_13115 [Runella slithyformis]TAG18186.1 MAG: hypothetical protein EAZ38_15585 [Cytophagales bacterium]TAG38138.1 MAG: hypothetical protein EAZ32_13260 [Cytophagia bacterium]TAG57636.1 MAG: hypothetical protein EAZ29_01935 [Runella slithyformis]TAG70392.1 MAG: hypothetical protein EAZ26_06120 [Runella slithyformis]